MLEDHLHVTYLALHDRLATQPQNLPAFQMILRVYLPTHTNTDKHGPKSASATGRTPAAHRDESDGPCTGAARPQMTQGMLDIS